MSSHERSLSVSSDLPCYQAISHNKEMGSIIAKSYHQGQGGGGGGVRMRGWQKRQMSEDSISPKKIRGLDDLMAELGLDHPEWKIIGAEEPGIKSEHNHQMEGN